MSDRGPNDLHRDEADPELSLAVGLMLAFVVAGIVLALVLF